MMKNVRFMAAEQGDFKTDQIMMSKFGKKIDIIAKKQEKILMKGEGERISKAREAKKNET